MVDNELIDLDQFSRSLVKQMTNLLAPTSQSRADKSALLRIERSQLVRTGGSATSATSNRHWGA